MKMKSLFPVFLALMFIITSCASVNKIIESGDYDAGIALLIRKIKGKKKKKAKYVEALEYAFQKATARDMSAINALKREGRGDNLQRIYDIQKQMKRRQANIEPLLPLYADNGIKAEFKFVRVDDMLSDTKKEGAEFQYEKGLRIMKDARRGDKEAARQAYREFEKIENYYRTYKDKDKLMAEALDLGRVYISFKMNNEARVVLPADFEREILQMSVGDINTRWKEFHTKENPRIDYDFSVLMRLTDIDVSPEQVKERQYEDSKEIEDGFEYVLDGNGNVAKDSLGNDIKVPKKTTIKAYVLETCQIKEAFVRGRLEYIDNKTRALVRSENVAAEAIFTNYASTYQGDKRALSKETKRNLGNRPVPFPTNEQLLLDAAEHLKPVVKDKIRNNLLI